MKQIFIVLFSVSLLIAKHTNGQLQGQLLIDSLLRELQQIKEDTTKVDLLNRIAYEYPYINPDKGIKYGRQSLAIAERIKWEQGIARANFAIGGNYETKADYPNALLYEYKALAIHKKNGDEENEALMLGNIGIIYHTQGDQSKALEYDSAAIAIYRKIKDTTGIARVLSNTGNVYSTLHQPAKTMALYQEALSLNERTGNKQAIALTTGNIANSYADEGAYNKAMPYYFRALRAEIAAGNKSGIARNMGNIGETYLDLSKGDIHPDSLIPAGKTSNLQLAIYYLDSCISISKQIKRPEFIAAFAGVLTDAYEQAGDYKEALKMHQYSISLRDSINNLEKSKEFNRRQMDYEYGQREAAIKYDKMRSQLVFSAISIVLLVLFVAIYRNLNNQKRSNAIISKEKKRSDDLLLNILPNEVAEELKDKGFAAAKHFDDVTVLFTDFVGFTKVSEVLTPQELINELHACFKGFDEITSKYNIEKIKTIGDAYLAISGAPTADQAHAENIVRAGLDIARFMQARKELLNNKTFEVRIGINSGNVVAGIVGVKKFAYDIWGDTVNVAARMEQNSIAGKINISQTTYDLVKNKFICHYRGEIEAKNKGRMNMYFVSE